MPYISKLKDKKHMIISRDAEKESLKIQHPFMIKTLQKLARGNLPQHSNSHIQQTHSKPTANIILNGEKLKAFPPRSGTRQECPLLSLVFNIVMEVLAKAIREQTERKESRLEKK